MMSPATYRRSRFLFERALALVYLVAFLVAANQFVPLLGEHGLLPVPDFVRQVPFGSAPSIFYLMPIDVAFRLAAWLGVALAALALSPFPARNALAHGALWAALWVLYVSFVNVGQTFYGFGWETLLLEAGFLAVFLGGTRDEPHIVLNWLWRWLVFRVMVGAGLIKLRGDPCWRDLTCLDYYFETQPMPNALSWYFHWLPAAVHHAGVLVNHVAELVVPFALFGPQPIAAAAAILIIAFQLTLIVSGNLSWLNWLTIVLAIPAIDDRWLRWIPVPAGRVFRPAGAMHRITIALAVVVGLLSIPPVLNLLSSQQLMNTSFEPLHLVNTYGAFGSITRQRTEIVIEGTSDRAIGDQTVWKEYEFKGKPGDTARRPSQIAPYHLRLDWLMWFAAMERPGDEAWFDPLLDKLLEGDPATLGLLRTNPFADKPPQFVRAEFYAYNFTTPEERRQSGRWWKRVPIGEYWPPTSLGSPRNATNDQQPTPTWLPPQRELPDRASPRRPQDRPRQ